MNVVITGATSFIGRHLVSENLRRGHFVTAVVRKGSVKRDFLGQNTQLHILELGIDEAKLLPNQLIAVPDVFFHMLWDGVRMPGRADDELQKKNTYYTLQFMRAAATSGANAFVGAGSQAEYGYGGKITEESPAQPTTAYGKAKLETWQQGNKLAQTLGFRFVWPRIFSIYGPEDGVNTLIASCLEKMLRNQDIPLTLGTQQWDYLYISDAVEALLQLGNSSAKGIYNVASGIAHPLKEYVYKMKSIAGSSSKLLFGAIPASDSASDGFSPSIEKIKTDTGWQPKISFDTGILEIMEGLAKHGNN